MYAWLEGDSLLVEEFGLPLWLAAGCSFACHSVGDDDAVCGGLLSALLPGCGSIVFCCVCCLCGDGVRFGA